MANNYQKGDVVRLTATFTDSAGTPTNPAAVTCKVKTPASATTTYTYGTDAALVRSATGIYYLDVDADLSGVYRYRWASTGAGKAAAEDFFVVEASDFD